MKHENSFSGHYVCYWHDNYWIGGLEIGNWRIFAIYVTLFQVGKMTRALFILSLLLASLACSATALDSRPDPAGGAASRPVLAAGDISKRVTVTALPTVGTRQTVTALKTVYVRPDPSTGNAPVGVLYYGQTVIVISCAHGWAQIAGEGWIYGKYISGGC